MQISPYCACIFCFSGYADHQDLHGLTHSFPTRRSSDLTSYWTCKEKKGITSLLIGSLRDLRVNYYKQLSKDKTIRSEEHTSELQSLMRISYAVFCLKKNKTIYITNKY